MMGFITDNERYNQVIDTWTRVNNELTRKLIEDMTNDKEGFNSVFMMMDSGSERFKRANPSAWWYAGAYGKTSEKRTRLGRRNH
jgi:hypothetical protein